MDGNGSLFGTLSGNTREVLHKFTVDLPKKHGRGGQSALRFARLRMEKRHNYVRKVRCIDASTRLRLALRCRCRGVARQTMLCLAAMHIKESRNHMCKGCGSSLPSRENVIAQCASSEPARVGIAQMQFFLQSRYSSSDITNYMGHQTGFHGQ